MILVDDRWIAAHGIGRFAAEVIARLPGAQPLPPGPDKLSPFNPLWLNATLRRLKPAVYFSPGFNPPLGKPAPFVFCIHDLIHLDVPGERSISKRLWYELLVKPAARRAEAVLTVSEYSRRRILEWTGVSEDRVINAGCGVSAGFAPEGPRRNAAEPYLLFVGSGKPHKNLKRLLQAFARAECRCCVKLALCAPADERLRGWLDRQGLGERVETLGMLSEADLQAAYRGAVGLAFPTLYEGFGLPALEAMACGTPVLTSGETSLPEVTGEAALVVDPLDVDSLAAGLDRLAGDAVLRSELSAKGLAQARRFSWDAAAGRVKEVLRAAGGIL